MNYYTIPPSKLLSGYIRFFWVFESTMPEEAPYIYRSMADGCAELLFHYKGSFVELDVPFASQPYSLLHGQSQRFRRFETQENFSIFGVYLYPYAIPALFKLPSTDFSNQMPDLQSVLGSEGAALEARVMLAKNTPERVEIVSAFLEKRVLKNEAQQDHIHSAIRDIIHSNAGLNVRQLAEKSCMSTRQFERKFKEYAGFSPKLFSRIIRFQSAMKAYENKDRSLTRLAYDNGYYDQSHFISDFREFSGYLPKQYFSGQAEGREFMDM
jgi:AraC-like DNA-binding protein